MLTFSVAAILPIETLTGIGTSFKIKSSSVLFQDDSNNSVMQLIASGIMLSKDLGVSYRSRVRILTATGAISSHSLATSIISPSGTTLHFTGNVNFRHTSSSRVMTVSPTNGVGILNTLNIR